MTHDPNLYITMALASLVALAMVTGATLAGWRSWLALKRQELGNRAFSPSPDRADRADRGVAPSTASRIEIADLKERIRKLEAIAAGVDL